MAYNSYSAYLTSTNSNYIYIYISATLNSSANTSDVSWEVVYSVEGSGGYYQYNNGNRLIVKLNNATLVDSSNVCAIQLSSTGSKVIASGNFSISHADDGTCSFPVYVYFDQTQRSGNDGTIDTTFYCDTNIRTFTNTIGHWAGGFKYSEGNNGSKNLYNLAYTDFTVNYGTSFKIGTDRAVTIPNGFYLYPTFGTSAISGSWNNYAMGTSVVQKASSMTFQYDYHPNTYSISYNLNGGTNNSNNPSTYNVLYGITVDKPTREGYVFNDWYCTTENKTVTISAHTTNNYNYAIALNNVQPNTQYDISMSAASITTGSATQFATLIYDFTNNVTLAETRTNFGNNINYSLTCPSSANASHDIKIIIYAGINGATSGKATRYSDVKIGYNLGYQKILFDSSNLSFKENGGISNGVYSESWNGYAATPNLIPVKGGITLLSNIEICGIYTYDSNGNFIKRESSYTTIHPISSNASYMRVELYVGGDITYDEYASGLIIQNAVGINVGDNATFSSSSDLYSKLNTRMIGNVTLSAIWEGNEYTLSLNSNGGNPDTSTVIVEYGSEQNNNIGELIPVKRGYKFLGMYSSIDDVQVYDENGLCTNNGKYWINNTWNYIADSQMLSLYAQWKPLNVAYYKQNKKWVLCNSYGKANNVKIGKEAGTYDANGNLLQTWDELMSEWQDFLSNNTSYSSFKEADVSSNHIPPTCVSNVIPSEAEMLIISDTVTSIGEYMFYKYGTGTNLKRIIIPKSVETIGHFSFAYQTNMECISIANSEIKISHTYGDTTNYPFQQINSNCVFYYSGTLTSSDLSTNTVPTILPYEDAPEDMRYKNVVIYNGWQPAIIKPKTDGDYRYQVYLTNENGQVLTDENGKLLYKI